DRTRDSRSASCCLPHVYTKSASGRSFSQLDVPACWYRCPRFDVHLAMHPARPAAKVDRYSFLCGALSSPTFCRSPGAHILGGSTKIGNFEIGESQTS